MAIFGALTCRRVAPTGALLLRMLRRGNALPAARFVWRVQDAQVQAML